MKSSIGFFLRSLSLCTLAVLTARPLLAQRTVTLAVTGNQFSGSGTAVVMLASQGNENVLSFSVIFDPAVLRYDGFSAGADATGATFNTNASQATSGRVGFLLGLVPGESFATGNRALIRLNFTVLAPSASTSLGFGDTPASRQVGDSQANSISATFSGLTVATLASQTITFAAPAAKTFGDAPFSLSASASSGLAVAFASSNPAVATVSGNTFTVVGAGVSTITASQSGSGNFGAATSVTQALNVNKALATLTLGGLAQIYNGSPWAASATTSPSALPVVFTYAGSSTVPTNAGTYAVIGTVSHANYTASTNGTLVVAQAAQIITFAAIPAKLISDAYFALSATASSALAVSYTSSNSAVATVSGNTVYLVGTGTTSITANQTGNANYVGATPVVQTLTVQQAPTISSAAAANFSVNTAGTFTVTATGSPAPTFTVSAGTFPSWAALNSTTGVISGTATNNSGSPFNFTLRASNGVGTVSDQAFVLTVQGTPVITAISAPRQVVTLGSNLTLTVTATSGTAHTYQWKRNGLPISGATNATYAITAAVPVRDNGWYQASVVNDTGAVKSAPVFVLVSFPSQVVGWGQYLQRTVPAGLDDSVAISAGTDHSLALRANGTVAAWGDNGNGESTVPSGLTDVVAISAGDNASLALKSDGTVVAWGRNSEGQTTVPSGLSGVVGIVSGYRFSVALKSDGTVLAWGSNVNGETVVPSGFSEVVAISSAPMGTHIVALRRDGTVACWGNTLLSRCAVPAGLTGVVSIAAGWLNTFALKADGSQVSWGSDNSWAQLTVPTLASLPTTLSMNAQVIALLRDGTVSSWGLNDYGQRDQPVGITKGVMVAAGRYHSLVLRDRSGDTLPAIAAQPVATASGAVGQTVRLSVGASAGTAPVTYQWRKDGSVISGATNAELSLPLTTTAAGAYDVEVSSYLGKVTSQAAAVTLRSTPLVNATQGGRYVLNSGSSGSLTVDPAFVPAGATVQWKRNGLPIVGATNASLAITSAGPLKDNGWYVVEILSGPTKTVSAPLFVLVSFPSQVVGWGQYLQRTVPAGLDDSVAISVNEGHSLALRANGTVVAWGDSYGGRTSVPAGLGDVVAVSACTDSSLALKADGTLVAWGSNTDNQTSLPVGLTGVVAITSGFRFSAALKVDGTVTAWGRNTEGQANVPGNLKDVVKISVASRGFHVLALRLDGTLASWGAETSGRTAIPPQATEVVTIAAGAQHNYISRSDGTLLFWGSNSYGELESFLGGVVPLSSTVANQFIARLELFSAQTPAATISANSQSLALLRDGTAAIWGRNDYGERQMPTGLNSIVSVATGQYHSMVLRDRSGDNLPAIAAQPVATTSGAVGQTVRLSVGASAGTAPVTYQWRKDGSVISGATNAELSLPLTTTAAGAYDVEVSSYLGKVTSQAAAVTLRSTPLVNAAQGGRYLLTSGSSGSLTVDPAFVPAGATVQWKRNGLPIAGATSAVLALANVQPLADAGAYQAEVNNGSVITKSARVFLIVWPKPAQLLGFGQNTYGQITIPADIGMVVGAAGGLSHSIALRPDGTVVAWGSNASGQTSVPAGLKDVVAVAGGYSHNLALTAHGAVVAWGSNASGETTVPAAAIDVVAVAAGNGSSCALLSDGSVVTWGRTEGTTMPADLGDVISIAAGASHQVALKQGGTLVAWGRNSESQISVPPQAVGVIKVVSFYYHNLAILQSGSVVAWGSNGYGQTTLPADLVVTSDIAAGSYHSLAVKPGGTVTGWGRNTDLQTSVPAGYSSRVVGVSSGGYHSLLLRDTSTDTVPFISAAPSAVRVTAGGSFTLSVTAGPILPGHSYQWRKGGTPVSGATGETYSRTAATQGDAGSYDVVVSNYLGSVTSPAAVVDVVPGPVVTSAPAALTIVSGDRVKLSVSATGTGPLTYQWFEGPSGTITTPVAGATGSALTTPALAATTSYWVRITDGNGNVTNSSAATVTVSATSPLSVTQVTVGPGYVLGGSVAITNTITYTGTAPSRIDWSTLLPAGWKYLGSGGSEGGVRPAYESGDLLEWTWNSVPPSPIKFTYIVSVPAGTTGDQVIASLVTSQAAGTRYQTMAKPDPLVVRSASLHSADSNRDGRLSLLELTRVIELYNVRSGSVRTGAYRLQAGTEDGFAPGP